MIQVSDETLGSIRDFVREKLGGAENERIFLSTPHPELGNRSPEDIMRGRDHFEVMQLSSLVASAERDIGPPPFA